MATLKPIETVYKGYKFRSRLEARWAVFFETLDIEWEYEVQGFDLGLGEKARFYLPDFEVNHNTFVEIKPHFNLPLRGEDEERFIQSGMPDALWRLPRLAELTGKNALLICGSPWPDEYFVQCFYPQLDLIAVYEFQDCRRCDGIGLEGVGPTEGFVASLICTCDPDRWNGNKGREFSRKVNASYNAARQARFEHGEKP